MILGYITGLSTTCESVQYERNVLYNLSIGFINIGDVKVHITVTSCH